MKRLFLLAIAVITMTMTSFAGETRTMTRKAFDMSYNVRQLSCCLGITIEQMNDLELEHARFVEEMKNAATAPESKQAEAVRSAITKDFKMMKGILNASQYEKYQLLMNTTYHNRGLDIYLDK
jgi:predicted secreted acid phosphatase